MRITIALLTALMLAGCVGDPGIAPPVAEPFYTINPNLSDKAAQHRASTIAMVNSSGLLLYKPYQPWGGDPRGKSNYLLSHNVADMPAWGGVLMQAIAFEWAVTGTSADALLGRLAGGIETMIDVTGVPGLIGRSAIPDYTGPRLDWMATEEQRPTRFWQQGAGGRWWRNGAAKDHWSMTVCGMAAPLTLERAGEIQLSATTRSKLVKVLVAVTRHLVDNGYRIRDPHGFTEFGDLRPRVTFGPNWPELPGLPNGFNQMLVLNALKAAGHHDPDLLALYDDVKDEWTRGIELSMGVAGLIVSEIGHSKIKKPSYSDMQAFGTAATSYLLDEADETLRDRVFGSLRGLWRYMEHENNPPFSLALARQDPAEAKVHRVVRLLRFFPGRDGKRAYHFRSKDTDDYQPIENRPPNTMYWKSSPFRVAFVDTTKVNTNPDTGDPQFFSGQDYLWAYWAGRHLGVVPER